MRAIAAFRTRHRAGAVRGGGLAQGYPSRPIRVVVPYPPGGGTDVLARLVGKYMNESFNQPIVVENRAGANAKIGMEVVAKSPPDGYTMMAIAAGPLNDENIKYFAPIALMAAPSYLLVVHPSVRANSVKELIALAMAQPGKIAYGSTGGGAASHLATELFRVMAGIELLHVPYKGVGQAVGDLLGGQVQMMIAPGAGGGAAGEVREAARPRRQRRETPVDAAGPADHRGGRRSRV